MSSDDAWFLDVQLPKTPRKAPILKESLGSPKSSPRNEQKLKNHLKDLSECRHDVKMQKAWKSMAGARTLLQPVDFGFSSSAVPFEIREHSQRKRHRKLQSLYAAPHTLQKSTCGNTWKTFSNGPGDLAWSKQLQVPPLDSKLNLSQSKFGHTPKALAPIDSGHMKAKLEAASSIDPDLFQQAEHHIAKIQSETVDLQVSLRPPPYGAMQPIEEQASRRKQRKQKGGDSQFMKQMLDRQLPAASQPSSAALMLDKEIIFASEPSKVASNQEKQTLAASQASTAASMLDMQKPVASQPSTVASQELCISTKPVLISNQPSTASSSHGERAPQERGIPTKPVHISNHTSDSFSKHGETARHEPPCPDKESSSSRKETPKTSQGVSKVEKASNESQVFTPEKCPKPSQEVSKVKEEISPQPSSPVIEEPANCSVEVPSIQSSAQDMDPPSSTTVAMPEEEMKFEDKGGGTKNVLRDRDHTFAQVSSSEMVEDQSLSIADDKKLSTEYTIRAPKQRQSHRESLTGGKRSLRSQQTTQALPVHEQGSRLSVVPSRSERRSHSIAGGDATVLNLRGRSSSKEPANSADPEDARAEHQRFMQSWIEGKSWLFPKEDARVCFSPNEKAIMRRYFELRDTDGSGALDVGEFMWVIHDMGRTPKEDSHDAQVLKNLLNLASDETDGELVFDNFLSMLAAYYTCVYDRIFHEQDKDGSGEIAQDELSGVLQELRRAGFDLQDDQMSELIAAVDTDGNGVLDFQEFCELMRQYRILEFGQLQKSSGWTTNQMLHLQTQFESADLDQSGSLEIKEVVSLLEKNPRGPSLETPEAVDRFIQYFARMDKDRSASLDFEEFLRLLRVWTVDGEHFHEDRSSQKGLLEAPGCVRASGIIGERAKATMRAQRAWGSQRASLDNDQVELMLRVEGLECDVEMGVLSAQWGIQVEEVHALRESFEFCDVDGSGKIDEDELVPLLENMGCPPSTQMQKTIISECLKRCDLGDDLNLAGTIRLVTTYQKALARAIVRSFDPSLPNVDLDTLIPDLAGLIDQSDTTGDQKPAETQKQEQRFIPMNKLVLAFYEVGQFVSRSEIRDLLDEIDVDPDSEGVSEPNFEKILGIHRTNKLFEWRRTYGFSGSQLKRFKKVCQQRCQTEAGDELRIKLDDVLPLTEDLGLAPNGHENCEELMRALMRVDRKGSGMVSFEEFVLLLRHLENARARHKNHEVSKAAKAAGLDHDAVQHFREAFDHLEGAEYVTKKSIRDFLKQGGVVNTVEKKKELEHIFKQIEEQIVGKPTNELNFAHFLWVLRGLDNNGDIEIV